MRFDLDLQARYDEDHVDSRNPREIRDKYGSSNGKTRKPSKRVLRSVKWILEKIQAEERTFPATRLARSDAARAFRVLSFVRYSLSE